MKSLALFLICFSCFAWQESLDGQMNVPKDFPINVMAKCGGMTLWQNEKMETLKNDKKFIRKFMKKNCNKHDYITIYHIDHTWDNYYPDPPMDYEKEINTLKKKVGELEIKNNAHF